MNTVAISRRLRELRGNTPREAVALAVGVTAQAIANYETGIRVPTDEIKIKLAEYYNTTVQELFFEAEVNET